jgi:hypothetical protein
MLWLTSLNVGALQRGTVKSFTKRECERKEKMDGV